MIISFIAVLAVLGFLIFIHELGHYLAAIKVGIKVETFSLGFGPRLFGFHKGDTDYRISAIPFGGYVKMAGEDMQNTTGALNELQTKPIPARLLVFSAGAAMNAVAAVLLTIFLAYIGIYIPAYTAHVPQISWVMPGSPAAESGLQSGDIIKKVNSTPVDNWDLALSAIAIKPDSTDLTIDRDGSVTSVPFSLGNDLEKYPYGGIGIKRKVLISSVTTGSPAEVNGLLPGDEITAINHKPLTGIEELMYLVNNSQGQALLVEVKRNDQTFTTSITPEYHSDLSRFLMGISFSYDRILERHGLLESVKIGFVMNYEISKAMFQLVGQLITGQASIKNLGGPVMIGKLAGEAAKKGFRDLLSLTAFISLNLAILNILPIPILDGGLILFLLIEAIRRKPISEKVQIVLQNVFFFILISFALIVTYNDVINLNRF